MNSGWAQSARTFARRFVEETGRTPMQWVTDQRVLYARRLLEETDLDIDRIADRAGFGAATLLRHHFRRIPIRVQRLDLSGFIHTENIDAFKVHLASSLADAASRPFHRGPFAGDENIVFS